MKAGKYYTERDDDGWTEQETARQDLVDEQISLLIAALIPDNCNVDWDIELIGIIRDALQEVIVDKLGFMTEQEFYPYREIYHEGFENND